MVVVGVSFVTKELVVDRKECIVDVGEGLRTLGWVFEDDGVGRREVQAIDGSVPLVKACLTLNREGSVGEQRRSPVITEHRILDPSILAIHVLEVWVGDLEIPDNPCEFHGLGQQTRRHEQGHDENDRWNESTKLR